MQKRYFPRLFVLVIALAIVFSLSGCDMFIFDSIDLPFGQKIHKSESQEDILYSDQEFAIGNNVVIQIDRDQDFSSYINSDGTITCDAFMGSDSVIQKGMFSIPVGPDGKLELPYDYEIISDENGNLTLKVDGLEDFLPDGFGDEDIDDGGYKLPNGDSINPELITELEDGTLYIDYDISHRFGGQTYCLTDGTYASVIFEDEFGGSCSVQSAVNARVYYIRWDNDTDYYNDLIQKHEKYRLSDRFLLESFEYSHAENEYGQMIEVSAEGLAYDEYENAYQKRGYTFDPRYGHRFATQEIFYEDEAGEKLSFIWEYDYNDSWGISANRNINADGIVTWEVLYDENCTILQTTERRPEEGYTMITEYENGNKSITNQYFEGSPYIEDGSHYIYYYEEDGTYAYSEEYDPEGILICKVFYDDEYNPTHAIYYDKDGNIIAQE